MIIDAFQNFPAVEPQTEARLQLSSHWAQLCQSAPGFQSATKAQRLEILHVWAGSDFLCHWCLRNPETFQQLWYSGLFHESLDQTAQRQRVLTIIASPKTEDRLLKGLRLARNQEMALIAWLDITQVHSTEQTLLCLTTLAELLIQSALDWLCQQQAGDATLPQLIILGMGKLGGGELNFSSDIDLIFTYHREGEDHSQPLTQLAQRLINALNSQTENGFVYRVDVRLRPFGDAGALVSSTEAMREYYLHHGREWERYALLKARPVAGDIEGGLTLLAELQPFIYRRYLDYSSIESLRDIKQLIAQEAHRKGKTDDLKVGPGGIREIEFITQVFQLTYGGLDRSLRTPKLLTALKQIEKRALLPAPVVQQLHAGYLYLRRSENHLQMLADQQVHRLPGGELERWRIAHVAGYVEWTLFLENLDQYRDAISRHFNQVFKIPGDKPSRNATSESTAVIWHEIQTGSAPEPRLLETIGYTDPAQVSENLLQFTRDHQIAALSPNARKRLDRIMPAFIEAAAKSENPGRTLARITHLISAIARRSAYLSLLAEQPEVLHLLVRLCAASPWIAAYLSKHPLLLDELIHPETLFNPPELEGLRAELDRLFERIDPEDEEQVLNTLRHFKQAQVLRVAAADIEGALNIARVSDHLSWIAEVTLQKVLALAWDWLVNRHGLPQYEADGRRLRAAFCILGYGKLGGYEMGYSSDLDLVFLHDSTGTGQVTTGERSIDNSRFFARLAQRTIHLLSAFTPAGKLYEVDIRLRPNGASGLLVTSLDAFERYQRENAWTWEHQALIRARPVAGDENLAAQFRRTRCEILQTEREPDLLRLAISQMRMRMWRESRRPQPDKFDLKRSPGGITDIEFMVQYWVLENAHLHPQLCEWTDNIHLLETLANQQVLSTEVARQLTAVYIELRNELHQRALQNLSARLNGNQFAEQQAIVKHCWHEVFGDVDGAEPSRR
ncbi:MAG: bifunctional [glutamate--ammonia ligase]-adenylyl-L-tyrosine phosphorylase/[glutamate--ammonia-ligase] adenylyltransferase [Thiotrichales bacterium]